MEGGNTRTLLLDAAKRLFVKNGFDGTTMIDIAGESGMSRRTLYSYFDSKIEIYQAVIDREASGTLEKLVEIAHRSVPPKQRILDFVYVRFAVVKEMVDHNGTLRSGFFRNSWTLEHFRKDFDQKERLLIMDIIVDGLTEGVFNVASVRRSAEMIQYCMRGFELPYIRGKVWQNTTRQEMQVEVRKLVYGILGCVEQK